MRIRIATTAMLGLLSALVACNSPFGPGTATLSAGCYTLKIGSREPIVMQLTEEPSEYVTDEMRIQPLLGEDADWGYASWTPTGDLGLSGLPGIKVSLTGSESPFRGKAEIYSDVYGVEPSRSSATLESRACPELDQFPTSVSIGGQSVELRAYMTTDPSGTSLLSFSVGLGLAGGLPGDVTGVHVNQLWVVVGDKVWQTSVERNPEGNLWQAGQTVNASVDDIEWDPEASVEVVARLGDQRGKQFLVRDAAVPFAHSDPIGIQATRHREGAQMHSHRPQ
jgi:hypothetical protein